MKLANKDDTPVVLQNVKTPGAFRIKNSAHAFKILSEGLYANKIRAIVRELSCNAVDSHVEAGTLGTPFVVHLPNKLEPHFSVRDFGVGLDHEAVTEIYTTYFESTKQDSNEFIGALGLGSKTPFSYTDNFTVIAIKDGKKRTYAAYIEQGSSTPAIALMDETDTKDHNGVEVKFSVAEKDFKSFYSEAQNVFKWFQHPPKVIGDSTFEIPEIEYQEKDVAPGIHILKRNESGYRNKSYAVQGNIAYPISLPQEASVPEELLALLACGIVIHFDIGELDIAASREELGYIDHTINSIHEKLKLANSKLKDYVKEQIKGIDSEWELAFRLKELAEVEMLLPAVRSLVKEGECQLLEIDEDSGHRRGSSIKQSKLLQVTLPEIEKMKLKVRRVEVNSNWSGTTAKAVDLPSMRDTSVKDAIKSISYVDFYLNKNIPIVVNDTSRGAISRVLRHLRSHRGKLDPNSHGSVRSVYVFDVDKEDVDKLDKILGKLRKRLLDPPFKVYYVSGLEDVQRTSVVSTSIIQAELKYRDRGYRRAEEYWGWDRLEIEDFEEEFDENEGPYYYVPVKNFTVLKQSGGEEFGGDYLLMIWAEAKKAKILPDGFTLYGVRRAMIDEVEGMDHWVNFHDYLLERMDNTDLSPARLFAMKSVIETDIINEKLITRAKTDLSKDSPYRKLAEFIEEAYNAKVSQEEIRSLGRLFSRFDKHADTFNDDAEKVRKKFKKVRNMYPMFRIISVYGNRDNDILFEYIQQTDRLRELESKEKKS